MRRELKEELAGYFEAPVPERKRVFVRQLEVPRINMYHVIAMQVKYISKPVWIFSGLFFCGAYILAKISEFQYVGLILGLIPFMVMLSVTESVRSYRYGMEELELSARFSLKSIVLARLLMLGVGNLLVLLISWGLFRSEYSLNIVYMMTPYFLTAGGSLCIVRVLRGRESVLPCFGLALLVATLQMYLPWRLDRIFAAEYIWLWGLACGIGVLLTAREGYRTIRMTEDFV